MRARRWDLYLEAGADFDETYVWDSAPGVPVDLSNYTATAQIRAKRWREGADTELLNPVLLGFATNVNPPAGRITLGADGKFHVRVDAAVLDALVPWRNPARFDLKLISNTGAHSRFIRGFAVLDARVSA